MTIRRATPNEAETLTRIALDAKRYWGYPEHWIRFWEADLTISPEFIATHEVYVAEENNETRGFYAICVSGNEAELEHLWVLPAYIGTGVGKELFLDAMERAGNMKIREVGITADPNAAGFYKHMGAEQVGEIDSEVEGAARKIPRYKLKLEL